MDVLLQAVVKDVVGERRVALEVDAGRRGSVLVAPEEEGRLLLGLVLDGHDERSLFRGGLAFVVSSSLLLFNSCASVAEGVEEDRLD